VQELDATDKRILQGLDDDPRVPIMVLAQRLGLARGTVQSRLERMTASGALRPNSSRVLPAALGRGVAASVSAELDQSHLNEAIAALRKIPEVLECHAPAGDTDLLIRVVATSPDDLYRVSEEIRLCPGIVRTSTYRPAQRLTVRPADRRSTSGSSSPGWRSAAPRPAGT
jgi:DNA-binding Lrp family transcriptional regulator